jgi:integrase
MPKQTKATAALLRANKFPLFKHARGRWCKKAGGKHHYLKKIEDDPEGRDSLDQWLREKEARIAGRTPAATDAITVKDWINRFLTAKQTMVDVGELSNLTFMTYHAVCETIVAEFGLHRAISDLGPADFRSLRTRLCKGRSAVTVGSLIGRARVAVRFAHAEGLIDRPIATGPDFKKPNKRSMRQARADAGPRMLEAGDLRRVIEVAPVHMRAMIYLGVNCAFGPGDVGRLPTKAVDFKSGWLSFARPKTGIGRRIPLWPETIAALRESIAQRPKPASHAVSGMLFLTPRGESFHQDAAGNNPTSRSFTSLLRSLKLHRPGLSFYVCRHVFATVAGGTLDRDAVSSVLGHVDSSMAGVYREEISDERLRAVTTHVRTWLFADPKKTV